MSSVESRIVTMKFDNAQFEQGARTSLTTLEKLKQSMNFSSASATASKSLSGISGFFSRFKSLNPFSTAKSGLGELDRASKSFGTQTVGTITGGITQVSAGFIAMSTVAITALANIVTAAVRAGGQMVKSLTIDPVLAGFQEYETNLNSIQTILANTGLEGQKGLNEVNAALQKLNEYSDQTIYNFSEMARNIGTFTAAGVDLDTATDSIKGIANLAALSGSNSQQASTAMYQLSQAISAGKVGLMDWNSVVNAGMGGKVFQSALARTATNMGTLKDSAVKTVGPMEKLTVQGGSFRESIMAAPGKESWLTGDVLTNTLKQLSGDMTDAELKAEGFTAAQITAIQKVGQTGVDAATKVKTLTQLMGTVKESIGSGVAKSFQLIIGDFTQAKELFTGVNDTLGGIIGRSSDARNKILKDWAKLGGREDIIEGISNVWTALLDVLEPIKDAFRDIFPAKTGADLAAMSETFRKFTEGLTITDETSDKLRRTFAGVFAIFSIIGQVIGAVADQFRRLFGAMSSGSGGFLEFTAGIGDSIVKFDRFLEKSGLLEAFFTGLGNILALPLTILQNVAEAIGDLFDNFDGGAAENARDSVNEFADSLSPLQRIGNFLGNIVSGIGEVVGNIGEAIGSGLASLGGIVAEHITPETFSLALKALNTALFGALVLTIRSFFKKGINIDAGGGMLGSIKETLGSVTGALTTMQQSLKADILLKIAAAIGIMALSFLVLSTIDGQDLMKAMAGMAGGLVILGGALVLFTKYISIFGAAKLPLIAAALIGLATAMLILATALKVFQSMEIGDLLRGLFGMGAALFIIKKSMEGMPLNMPVTAAGILILAIAMNAMAVALKLFATISWEEMSRGLAALAGSLIIIAATMRAMPVNMPVTALGILILSVALNVLAGALKLFAMFSWEDMAHGGVALAGALFIIAMAMRAMPLNLPIVAAGLVLVAIALNGIALALKLFASMSWDEIAHGLVALGGAMAILALGLIAMSGSVAGALALTIATAALSLLVPVLILLGTVSWETIIKSLTFLAGIFVILGLAGLFLGPVLPVIFGLAVALVLIGAALALAGVGALAFATAFGIIVGAGVAGVNILREYLSTLIEAIPEAMSALAQGIVSFLQKLANNGPKFVTAMGRIIGNILDAVRRNIPKMGQLFTTLILTALRVITTLAPRIFAAGLALIVGFLRAVSSRIGEIVGLAADIIVKFLNALGNAMPRIVNAGAQFIIKVMNGVATAIRENGAEFGEAGANIATAIIEGLWDGIIAGGQLIIDALVDLAHDAWDAAMDFLHLGSPLFADTVGAAIPGGIALGIKRGADEPIRELNALETATLAMIRSTMGNMGDKFDLEADMNPTITPVLDLTNLTREANKMTDLLPKTSTIQAGVSYNRAADISAATKAAAYAAQKDKDSKESSVRELNFEQHNHSPKALDHVTIYRATRNQISLAREALAK